MAQGKIIVETAQLDAASAKVGELAGTYKGEYEKLYKLVEELQASWAGADNTAYTTQIEDYDNPDIAYVKLTMYEAILNLIHEQRRAFMRADIEAKEILSLFEMIYRNTDNLDVLQEKSIQKKASILEQKDLFISDIESIYNEE